MCFNIFYPEALAPSPFLLILSVLLESPFCIRGFDFKIWFSVRLILHYLLGLGVYEYYFRYSMI